MEKTYELKEAKENESDKERLERLAKNTDFKLLKPFGPSFGIFHAPSEVTFCEAHQAS